MSSVLQCSGELILAHILSFSPPFFFFSYYTKGFRSVTGLLALSVLQRICDPRLIGACKNSRYSLGTKSCLFREESWDETQKGLSTVSGPV